MTGIRLLIDQLMMERKRECLNLRFGESFIWSTLTNFLKDNLPFFLLKQRALRNKAVGFLVKTKYTKAIAIMVSIARTSG